MRAHLTRRAAALGLAAAAGGALPGCAALRDLPIFGELFEHWPRVGAGPVRTPDYDKTYGRIEGEAGPVPAFDYTLMDSSLLRANVAYQGPEPPGAIVVEPGRHALYLVERDGRATRYGVATGREAAGWSGSGFVGERRKWPDLGLAAERPDAWARLVSSDPASGRNTGPALPYGARMLALFAGGRDTGYRIHGTDAPETVGSETAFGCLAMINQDVIHLHRRAPQGAPIVVLA